MRDFARSAEMRRTAVDPVLLVRETAESVGADLEGHLLAENAPKTWPLDEARMRQVLANVLHNAVQAG